METFEESDVEPGPKPGTPHVINVHGFTLNKIYQKQKQKQNTACSRRKLKYFN